MPDSPPLDVRLSHFLQTACLMLTVHDTEHNVHAHVLCLHVYHLITTLQAQSL